MAPPSRDCTTQDNTRADGMSGKVIYDLMNGGPGTGSLNATSTTASTLTTRYNGYENRLRTISSSLGEGWTGSSADAAQRAASPINQSVINMQSALGSVDRSVDSQAVQFVANKNALKPMPADKPESGFWNDVTPWETDTDRAIAGYNNDEAENRRIYTQYQGASNTNRDQLPSELNGVTVDSLDVGVVDSSSNKVENSNSNGKFTNNQSSSSSWNGGDNQGNQGSVSTFTPVPGSTGTEGTTTTSGDVGVPTVPSPSVQNPGQGVGGGPNNPGGGGIGLPPFGGPGGVRGGGGGGGRPGGGGGAGGVRGGGSGGGGLSGRGAGGAGRGVGGAGVGGGFGAGRTAAESGFGPGGKAGLMGAGEGAAGRGGFGPVGSGAVAGGRGGAAGGGAGMGGTGGGRGGPGEEDGEHKSAAYLVNEENGNEIVGDMPMTAPPVLGG